MKKIIFELPEWANSINDNAVVSVKDLSEMFSIQKSTIRKRISMGTFPCADYSTLSSGGKLKNGWLMSNIREYVGAQMQQDVPKGAR